MALDFFGVYLQGQIQTFDSSSGKATIYDLWTSQPGGGNALLPPELNALSYVSQITTEMRLGLNAKISLVLTPPFEEGLAFLDSRLIQWGIGRLSVAFGYKTGSGDSIFGSAIGLTAGPFIGLLQKPSVSIGTDITITLHALGVGYSLNLIGGGDPRTFPVGYSFADAVEELLKEVVKGHGADLSGLYDDFKGAQGGDPFFAKPARVAKRNADFAGPEGAKKRDAEIVKIQNETQAKIREKEAAAAGANRTKRAELEREILILLAEQAVEEDKINAKYAADQEPGPIHVGPRNSWWFIHETLRNYGKELLIIGDKVKVVASENWLLQRKGRDGGDRKHFQVRGRTDPGRNMFPVLSFNSPTSAVYLSPGVGKVAVQDIPGDKTRENSGKKTYDSSNTPSATTGEGEPETDEVTPLATKPTDATMNMPGSPHDPATIQKARAEWKRMRMESGIRAQVTTLGVPTLIPGEVVQISGFLPRGQVGETDTETKEPARGLFDGAYGVIRVVHTVGNGGYMTKFDAVSNFFPRQWANARKTKSAKTDIQEPKEGSDKSRVTVEAS